MQLTIKIAKPPIIQIALDYATSEEALAMAKIGVEAGVDWLEIGTPLIVSQGVAPIGHMVRAFPNYPVLADYKTMDSGFKNVERTAAQGGHVMTVCANAPDETVQSAISEGKKIGIWVVADTIGVKDQPARAQGNAPSGASTWSICTTARINAAQTPLKIRLSGWPKCSAQSRFPSVSAAFWSKMACGQRKWAPI